MTTIRKKRRALGQNPAIRASRRRELIEAAIHVIAQHGRAGCTVGRVAQQAGLSQGLMNFHFKSIDRLLVAAFDHLAAEFDSTWQRRVAAAGPDPEARIAAMIEAYFVPEIFTPEKLAVWFTFWVDADLRDAFRSTAVKVERRYHRDVETEIARMIGNGADEEASRLTGLISAMVDGYWLQALLYPKTFKPRAAVQACLALLEREIAAA